MNVTIRFKGFDASDSVRHYVEDRATKLDKFLPPTAMLNATLEDDKVRKIAELNLRHKGSDYVAKMESENLLSSIDEAVDKLVRQISRAKDKKSKRSGNTKDILPDL